MGRLIGPAAALGLALAAGAAMAQSGVSPAPEALRAAPPEIDSSRPATRPGTPDRRAGGGPTVDGIVGDREGGGSERDALRPPDGRDPGIRGGVPDAALPTMPTTPPPGAPGGNPSALPR